MQHELIFPNLAKTSFVIGYSMVQVWAAHIVSPITVMNTCNACLGCAGLARGKQ